MRGGRWTAAENGVWRKRRGSVASPASVWVAKSMWTPALLLITRRKRRQRRASSQFSAPPLSSAPPRDEYGAGRYLDLTTHIGLRDYTSTEILNARRISRIGM